MEARTSDGFRIKLVIPSEKMKAAPKWSPEKGEPPLTIANLIKIATSWARNKYKRFDDVKIGEISLMGRGCWANEGYWYYQVDFTPIMDGNQLWSTAYFAAVLMDGTVIEPVKEK